MSSVAFNCALEIWTSTELTKGKDFLLEFTSSGIIWLSLIIHNAGTGDWKTYGSCPPLTHPAIHIGGEDFKGRTLTVGYWEEGGFSHGHSAPLNDAGCRES